MIFGTFPVAQAEGTILAHSVRAGPHQFKKGRRLTKDDIEQLQRAGVRDVLAARLECDDLSEDDAARKIAQALITQHVEIADATTGRVNIFASTSGIFSVDATMINAINGIDHAVTLASLHNHVRVRAGQMLATVKIIPFAVAQPTIQQITAIATTKTTFAVQPFLASRVGLVQTMLPSIRTSVLDKTRDVTAARIIRNEGHLVSEVRVPHEVPPLAQALSQMAETCDLIIIFGASAVADPFDVLPQAIIHAGGIVERIGMPVDPGNLLVIGKLAEKTIIGAPGSARGPKLNGLDWILNRAMAGIDVTPADLGSMGVGGLLLDAQTPSGRKNNRPGTT